jgi:hypothetical protein
MGNGIDPHQLLLLLFKGSPPPPRAPSATAFYRHFVLLSSNPTNAFTPRYSHPPSFSPHDALLFCHHHHYHNHSVGLNLPKIE